MKTIKVVAAIIRDRDRIFATQRGYGEYKDGWEFPGGKVEPRETPQEALVREIKEELDAEIVVGDLLTTVEYDYPTFHLSMDCFWATLVEGSKMKLLEHEAAKWLTLDELDGVEWLPADIKVVESINRYTKITILKRC
ncbi:MAG: (deoxy)nucleoside triphosphate pyrophosphohydrolase [Clostridiales bacterium]|nr:(deoxy)nucleoside triphosphate pyrophosphohydrolase [Clostridiales bacterium]